MQLEYCSEVGCFEHNTFMFDNSLLCMLGVGCGGFNKEHSIFCSLGARFIKTPRACHAKMSLTRHELIKKVLCLNLNTNPKHVPKTYQTWTVLDGKQHTPVQTLVEIKG